MKNSRPRPFNGRLAFLLPMVAATSTAVTAAVTAAAASEQPPPPKSGAKSMFYRQHSNPKVDLNTGIQYWVELKRGDNSRMVSNKYEFRSGDRIKLHIKPNIDCFAYVLLKEGSGGEQSVLFPDPAHADNNKFAAGVDHLVPGDGYLRFDSTPGLERLILLFSRTPVNAQAYLKDSSNRHVEITAHQSGAKDLVPGSVVLEYSGHPAEPSDELPTDRPGDNPEATTVVQTDPNAVLALDVLLKHSP